MSHLAVFDRSYVGAGASGRNTTLIRSAFTTREWITFFHEAVRLWEGLSQELGYNVMFTQRGYLILAASERTADLCRQAVPLQNSLGVSTRLVDTPEIRKMAPRLDLTDIRVGVLERSGGTA